MNEMKPKMGKICFRYFQADEYVRTPQGCGIVMEDEKGLDEKICLRSRDWAQVRPEWGLANNAAFIATPRERTRGLNLGGRTFLHNYDAKLDAEKSTLELIMVAPMVVASWINLQYYGSTVNNRLFGSGNKVLHNVVGTFGVWQGNGGDLRLVAHFDQEEGHQRGKESAA